MSGSNPLNPQDSTKNVTIFIYRLCNLKTNL